MPGMTMTEKILAKHAGRDRVAALFQEQILVDSMCAFYADVLKV